MKREVKFEANIKNPEIVKKFRKIYLMHKFSAEQFLYKNSQLQYERYGFFPS